MIVIGAPGSIYAQWEIKSKPYKVGKIYYVDAKCSCGSVKVVKKNNILSGRSKSCGCTKAKTNNPSWNAKRAQETGPRKIYEQYRYSAKKRDLIFSLTKKEFNNLIDKPCKYCGKEKSNTQIVNIRNEKFSYNGIDRIDNNKGYVLYNCIPCCNICNKMKSVHRVDEWLTNVIKIANNLNNININNLNEKKLDRYHKLATTVASFSHDLHTKVGALLINQKSGATMCEGFNGFVRGAPDDKLPKTRPEKYKYIIHAETNLLCNAVRHGVKTSGCYLYTTMSPCTSCARMLWQAGIDTIYFKETYRDFKDSVNMGDLIIAVEKIGKYSKMTIRSVL